MTARTYHPCSSAGKSPFSVCVILGDPLCLISSPLEAPDDLKPARSNWKIFFVVVFTETAALLLFRMDLKYLPVGMELTH